MTQKLLPFPFRRGEIVFALTATLLLFVIACGQVQEVVDIVDKSDSMESVAKQESTDEMVEPTEEMIEPTEEMVEQPETVVEAPFTEELGQPAVIADNSAYETGDDRPNNLARLTDSWNTNWDFRNIEWDDVLSGGPARDGIPSIDNPRFEPYEKVDVWLAAREPVIAIELNGDARAYPLGILTRHEIVNDTIGNVPIIATFCPLCNSAIVFDRRVGDETFEFGVSGLLRHSDMIMYDRTTESLWQQFTGEGIAGDLTGTQLTFLPSQIISYADFKAAYPTGQVLAPATSQGTGYNPYAGYDTPGRSPFLFRGDIDPRLDAVARVVTMAFDDGLDVAYPVDILAEQRVVNDTQGSHDIVLFWTPGTASALGASVIAEAEDVGATGVFDPNVDGRKLTFSFDGENIRDNETGSVWSITGQALSGELAGTQLNHVIHADHFWFSWVAFKPETVLYTN